MFGFSVTAGFKTIIEKIHRCFSSAIVTGFLGLVTSCLQGEKLDSVFVGKQVNNLGRVGFLRVGVLLGKAGRFERDVGFGRLV